MAKADPSRKRGLPRDASMKHDRHYVEELAPSRAAGLGTLIRLDRIEPNQNQPRRQFDDLEGLKRSIANKGVLEPILVQPKGSRYQILAGERRYRAALLAGLEEIPAIVMNDVTETDALEIGLIENLQRKDLTPFEEAEGLEQLRRGFGYTHDKLAKRLGKARTSITESLRLNAIPHEIRKACQQAGLRQKSLLLEVAKQPNRPHMLAMVETLSRGGMKRDEARQIRRKPGPGRPKNYVFRYAPSNSPVKLELRFSKSRATQREVISALETILRQIRRRSS